MTTNLAPGVSPAHDHFWPEDEPAEIAYCEDPTCGYEVDAFEIRYDEDPCCPECGTPLQDEPPAPPRPRYTIAYRDPLTDRLRRACGEPDYPTRIAALRALLEGRGLRFEDHPDIGLSYRTVDTRELS